MYLSGNYKLLSKKYLQIMTYHILNEKILSYYKLVNPYIQNLIILDEYEEFLNVFIIRASINEKIKTL